MTRTQLKEFATFFLMQLFTYSVCCFSYRAVAQAAYVTSVGIDLVYSMVNFWIIKAIAESKSRVAFAGYVCGSTLGTVLGIFVSKRFLGQ